MEVLDLEEQYMVGGRLQEEVLDMKEHLTAAVESLVADRT